MYPFCLVALLRIFAQVTLLYYIVRTVQSTLHFTPWQNCSFTLHPLAELFLYTSPPGRTVPLHFTPWQNCSFTLHPLAELFLYTSPPGRTVPLHFTPWQNCSFTLHPLAELFLYTSPPGRTVHSNMSSQGSILPCKCWN